MGDYEFDYKGFMNDFRIADIFGVNAIRDTFNRCQEEWKDNADYYASFVMTLNHLIWFHYDNGNIEIANVYNELWRKADAFVYTHFKGDELNHILSILD